jgi:hypothetical protein
MLHWGEVLVAVALTGGHMVARVTSSPLIISSLISSCQHHISSNGVVVIVDVGAKQDRPEGENKKEKKNTTTDKNEAIPE